MPLEFPTPGQPHQQPAKQSTKGYRRCIALRKAARMSKKPLRLVFQPARDVVASGLAAHERRGFLAGVVLAQKPPPPNFGSASKVVPHEHPPLPRTLAGSSQVGCTTIAMALNCRLTPAWAVNSARRAPSPPASLGSPCPMPTAGLSPSLLEMHDARIAAHPAPRALRTDDHPAYTFSPRHASNNPEVYRPACAEFLAGVAIRPLRRPTVRNNQMHSDPAWPSTKHWNKREQHPSHKPPREALEEPDAPLCRGRPAHADLCRPGCTRFGQFL